MTVAPRDIPVIFSPPMVRAELDDMKNMTRRLAHVERTTRNPAAGESETYMAPSPWQKVRPGDRLWVREEWRVSKKWDDWAPTHLPARTMTVMFTAGGSISNHPGGGWRPDRDYPAMPAGQFPDWAGRRRASMHLPRWASRLTLIVTAVKIEKLRDISEEDAIAEGVSRLFTEEECRTAAGLIGTKPEDHGWRNYLWHGLVGQGITQKQADSWHHQFSSYKAARDSFSSLWVRLHGPGSWRANPDVVAVSFQVIKANIDSLEARAA